jgi:hypothetical protein
MMRLFRKSVRCSVLSTPQYLKFQLANRVRLRERPARENHRQAPNEACALLRNRDVPLLKCWATGKAGGVQESGFGEGGKWLHGVIETTLREAEGAPFMPFARMPSTTFGTTVSSPNWK